MTTIENISQQARSAINTLESTNGLVKVADLFQNSMSVINDSFSKFDDVFISFPDPSTTLANVVLGLDEAANITASSLNLAQRNLAINLLPDYGNALGDVGPIVNGAAIVANESMNLVQNNLEI